MPQRGAQDRPTIGVLAGWQYAWTATPLSYLDPVYRGISRAARDLDCNLVLACGMGAWTTEGDVLRTAWPISSPDVDFVPIGPWNMDGLIVVNPLHLPALTRYVQDLRENGHPVIFVGSGEAGPTVSADNRFGTLEAMRHLAEHGHRRIAFIAGSREDIAGDTGERLRAYQDAVALHALVPDPYLVAWGHHVYRGGYAAMQALLDAGVVFSAVMVSNDESAIGAMQAIREAGFRIPQDVAIIGFDDRPESVVQTPALSSVHIPLEQMGYRALQSLVAYLTGRTESIASSTVETRLVARESCGCGQTSGDLDALSEHPGPHEATGTPDDPEQLVEAMAAVVLDGAWDLSREEAVSLCRRLVSSCAPGRIRDDSLALRAALRAVLARVNEPAQHAHAWGTALTMLASDCRRRVTPPSGPVYELLEQARTALNVNTGRWLRRQTVDRHWMLNRLGALTANLLAARDENEVTDILAEHLPTMGVETVWLAQFEAAGDDSMAWTVVRSIVSQDQSSERRTVRIRSREFPPRDLLPEDATFGLALFPLSSPMGQLGYLAFDTAQLGLYGAISQQLATALHSVALYREAIGARQQAEDANELKSRFLSTVSHELRTPLSLVVGLSSILVQESEEGRLAVPEHVLRDVAQIHANAQHLGGMVGDVLDLASSDAGRLHLAFDYVDLSDALRLVAETGRQLAEDKGLRWHADLPARSPWVWGDRVRLRQVVLNLVNNAVKFTNQGHVSLAVTSEAGSATVTVRDTGLGIPPAEQSIVFDEFRRSERSLGRGYHGLGLGLAISRRLVEQHGGTVSVRSSGGEGAGSTFYVTLPMVQPPAAQAMPVPGSLGAEASVMLVSHRDGMWQQLSDYLSGHGLAVETAFTDGAEDWLSQLVASPPGAVIVDVSSDPHQGWGVLRAIKRHPKTRALPVLFCSLSPEGGAVVELDYLTKPIELTDLTRALDQHGLVPHAEHGASAILVVDDDPETLEMHARIARDHLPAHRVLATQTGEEALELLQTEQVDLVLLDLIMPGMDGFGVLEAMRESEATRRTPVIVVTGQVLTEDDMARLSQGVASVLSKGLFSLEETLSHVDAALDQSRRLSSEARRLVRQAMAYIHTHYAEPLSRTDLAHHVALNEDYLTSSFRAELGVTPIAYLNRYRVYRAKQLLSSTDKSITEISGEVGFSDSGYFSRIFRREVGLSPDAYRRA